MKRVLVLELIFLALVFIVPQIAYAHCDTLDGPVVADAKIALGKGDITPVLKWIKPADEAEIKQAFGQTLKVRGLNVDAQKLADFYFFETLVRVHRAGEGVPYTGLKAAGAEVDPGIAAADKSLAAGKVEPVIAMLNENIAKGITTRFKHAMETKQRMNDSVDHGREYVEAYVEYIHYVERLVGNVSGEASGHSAEHHGSPAKEDALEHSGD